ncbi:MAG TPA: response regulator [Thermomicrobiales bacterium]|jgi:DNA-binding response OmpR family regulator|nr:response regulator [Thermomicrobiales bacterium]
MSPLAALTQTSPMTVAIVEDQAAIAELLHDVLEDAGYAPVIISSPMTAVAEIAASGAQIVLLDIMMPRKNGWEVLDELRAEPVTRDLPVVLTSAVYDRIGRRPLPFGGPIRFASKPFDVTELVDTIEGFRTRNSAG